MSLPMHVLEGNKQNGIPTYAQAATKARSTTAAQIEQENANYKCSVIALAILAVIAAAGAAVLFAYSGGPSQLEIFVSGIGSGVIALALLISLVVKTVKSNNHKAEVRAKLDQILSQNFELKDVYAQMKKANSQQIESVIDSCSDAMRKQLTQFVSTQLGDNEELANEERKVLEVLIKKCQPQDLHFTLFSGITRSYALMWLRHGSDDLFSGSNKTTSECVDLILSTIAVPQSKEEAQILACHPTLVANYLCQHPAVINSEKVQMILDEMDLTQKKHFFSQISANAFAIEGGLNAQVMEVVAGCIEATFTEEFAHLIIQNDSKNESVASALGIMKEITIFPKLVGETIYFSHAYYTIAGVVESVSRHMSQANLQIMHKYVSDESRNISEDEMYACLVNYDKEPLPETTFKRLSHAPKQLADAIERMSPSQRRDTLGNQRGLIQLMEREEGHIHLFQFYEFERGHDIKRFAERIGKDLDENKEKSLYLEYFRSLPIELRSIIINLKNEGAEEVGYNLGLNLLNLLDSDAEPIIATLDLRGQTSNALFFGLMDQLAKTISPGQQPVEQVPMGKLWARFRYAHLAGWKASAVDAINNYASRVEENHQTTAKMFRWSAEVLDRWTENRAPLTAEKCPEFAVFKEKHQNKWQRMEQVAQHYQKEVWQSHSA